MKVAILGTGRMAEIRLATLSSLSAVDEVVICGDPRRRAELAERFDAAEGDQTALGDDVEALVVCTKTSDHIAGIELAAGRRIPVFCEKPIALTLEESQAALAMLSAAGLELQVGFHRRFDPEIGRIRELWASGELGTPYVVRLASHDRDLTPEHYIPTSGGIWRDLHIHDFDLLRFLAQEEVRTVFAYGAVRLHERFREHGDSDSTAALLVTESGLPCVVTGTRHDPGGYDVRAEVVGSKLSVAAGIGPRASIRSPIGSGDESCWEGFADRFAAAFASEMEAFIDFAAGNGENLSPGGASVEALRIAVACELSVRERRQVALDEIRPQEEVAR
jgi:myo-inositol 2-dehydrogenase / D-chiro-inositol 1-dehydrogenase